MTIALQVLLWFLILAVAYVYIGYPLFLAAIVGIRGSRSVKKDPIQPTVTLLISAFNEEDVIAQKIANSADLAYPKERLDVIVISDASDDGTDEIVQESKVPNVRLLRMEERGGKTLGLNKALEEIETEIVIFSDANAMYHNDAIVNLVRNFSADDVGVVVGESGYSGSSTYSAENESLYWRYETLIKRLESRVGSAVGGDGAIYAIRRELYTPMAADDLSDFLNPLQIVRQGYRCVYEPEAMCFEEAAESLVKEYRRKVRIVNRAWRATFRITEMLNPFRFGIFSVQLISHKLLRWLVLPALFAAFATNALLLGNGTFFALLFGLQLAFYFLVAVGFALRCRDNVPMLFSVPLYFFIVNLASAQGILEALRGRKYVTWTTPRSD